MLAKRTSANRTARKSVSRKASQKKEVSKVSKEPRKQEKTLYACGVDWQHEIKEASDLNGNVPLYYSIADLKRMRTCWHECGIVRIKLTLEDWEEAQDFSYRKGKDAE